MIQAQTVQDSRMNEKISDIEPIILDIERAALLANDATVEPCVREDGLMQFVKRNAEPLLDLLDELKRYREGQAGDVSGLQKSHRVIIEGYSDVSAEAALSSALDKAAHYFSEDHDIAITVQQLIELPNGGHRATLEVHVTPFTLRDNAHIKGLDVELKRGESKEYYDARTAEEEHLHHLIFDHFSGISKAKTVGHIPPSFLINVTDVKLMNHMIEKQFLKAEGFRKLAAKANNPAPDPDDTPDTTPDITGPNKILVRVQRGPD
jgi:hypothetical protein